jgi:hypothetical protein
MSKGSTSASLHNRPRHTPAALTIIVSLLTALLLAPLAAAPARAASSPVGYLEQPKTPTPGYLSIRGWAYDPDAPNVNLRIHLYLGGPAGTPGAVFYDLGPTNKARPDVKAKFPKAGPTPGYEAVVKSPAGVIPVYAYGIDATGGKPSMLGTATPTVTANAAPLGALDTAVSPNPGKITVSGWAFDPNSPVENVSIHIYIGGPIGTPGAISHDIGPTSLARPDVQAIYPQAQGSPGFSSTIDAPAGTSTLWAYALDATNGPPTLLGSKAVTTAAPSAPTNPIPATLVATTTSVKVLTAKPKAKKKVTVKIRVAAATTPAGIATFTLNGKTVRTITVKSTKWITLTLPKMKKGKRKVIATFTGAGFAASAKTFTLKVR